MVPDRSVVNVAASSSTPLLPGPPHRLGERLTAPLHSAVTFADKSGSARTWRISSRITSAAATSRAWAYPRRNPYRLASGSAVVRTGALRPPRAGAKSATVTGGQSRQRRATPAAPRSQYRLAGHRGQSGPCARCRSVIESPGSSRAYDNGPQPGYATRRRRLRTPGSCCTACLPGLGLYLDPVRVDHVDERAHDQVLG